MPELKIKKRNGNVVKFDKSKISNAIIAAMNATGRVNVFMADNIAEEIEKDLYDKNNYAPNIEFIQDLVVEKLIENKLNLVAINYATYRERKKVERYIKQYEKNSNEKKNILSEDFINSYKKIDPPFTNIGLFTYLRTYSNWIESLGRREKFYETIGRAVEYNCSLLPIEKGEAECLYDNAFNLKQFLSGRTYWVGGRKASKLYPLSNFNCSGLVLDDINKLSEIFYLLMVGAGVGVRLLDSDVVKLPNLRYANINIINIPYEPKEKQEDRIEHTLFRIKDDNVIITIGDSKEGWIESLNYFFEVLQKDYDNIRNIFIDYNNIRPAGCLLKTSGGFASGPQGMIDMFTSIMAIIINGGKEDIYYNIKDFKVVEEENNKYKKLDSLQWLDIVTTIGKNVVIGGTRRTAIICVISPDNERIRNCKNDWNKMLENGLNNRFMSNNSLYFDSKPSYEVLEELMNNIKNSGEPGFVNAEAAKKRREDFAILNP